MGDWSRILLCDSCGKGNPCDIRNCLNCGATLKPLQVEWGHGIPENWHAVPSKKGFTFEWWRLRETAFSAVLAKCIPQVIKQFLLGVFTGTKKYHVFISYSRKDISLVQPIVELMRTTGVRIFRDQDSIPRGKQWRILISSAIQDATTFILFWSQHAASSPEVRKEFFMAIAKEKDIVPVLMDNTPLMPQLVAYNGIDLRPILAYVFDAWGAGRLGYDGGACQAKIEACAKLVLRRLYLRTTEG